MSAVIELKGGELFGVDNYVDLGGVQKADGGTRVAVVSTETPDGVGDIIHQGKNKKGRGWLLERFNRVPVMLWQHDIWTPNISAPTTRAVVKRMDNFGRSLILSPVEFDEEDPFAAGIAGKVDRRVIRESSVGFIGKIWERIDGGDSREFFEQELFEVSWANRGMNPDTDTLTKAILGNFATSAIVGKIEDTGDPEVMELKESLADAESRIAVMETAIKNFGRDEQRREAVRVMEARKNRQAEVDALVNRIAAIGISHA